MTQALKSLSMALIAAILWTNAAVANADRGKIEEFLTVTGFDVALESIKLSAGSAPQMLGLEAEDFGFQWTQLTQKVFDTDQMHELAIDILGETLTDELLDHANAFYGSDLGKRLVEAENASHMEEDDAGKTEAGEAIFTALVGIGSARVEDIKRMNDAIGGADSAIRAIQEIQVRFLMAAAGAGVIELQLEEEDLREMLSSQEDDMRLSIQANAMSGAAYTYQSFSDEDVKAYADALEDPKMKRVYELMNAVQYEIMANRFEAMATEMSKLQPTTDL